MEVPQESTTNTNRFTTAALVCISMGLYAYLGYAHQRQDFGIFIFCMLLAFASMGGLLRMQLSGTSLFRIGLLLRIVWLFALPQLSDDYFRFLWDGAMVWQGFGIFEQTPTALIEHFPDNAFMVSLYERMNSPDYYSVYPPLCQSIFALAAFPENEWVGVMIIRAFFLFAEIGIFFLLKHLLAHYRKPSNFLGLYWLNPAIIMEFVGNLHFECFLILGLLAMLYFLQKNELTKAGIGLWMSIAAKLNPLMLFPAIGLSPWSWQRAAMLVSVGLATLLSWVLMIDISDIPHLMESLDLYFHRFEFNASMYFLVREIGFAVKGYNIIGTAGTYLSMASLLFIIGIAFMRWPLPKKILFSYFVYLSFASIVHPWYALALLPFGLLSGYLFPFVWSITASLSYYAYSNADFAENFWLIGMEYGLVWVALIWEMRKGQSPMLTFITFSSTFK